MTMKRRDFLKSSIVAPMLAVPLAAAAPSAAQEFYELRAYRIKAGADHGLLDDYLAKAALPALNRLGCEPVGVFNESEPKEETSVYVLTPYSSLETFARVSRELENDSALKAAGAKYLNTPKDNPAYARIDSWLMRAFAGLPRMDLPSYSKEKRPRIFEMRTYESHNESKALKKVEMFNSGEIDLMRELGMGPIFFGQALVGPALPHLTYMLSAENREAHKQHWSAFGKHPTWKKMSADPQYADTVSKITSTFLVPAAFSQI